MANIRATEWGAGVVRSRLTQQGLAVLCGERCVCSPSLLTLGLNQSSRSAHKRNTAHICITQVPQWAVWHWSNAAFVCSTLSKLQHVRILVSCGLFVSYELLIPVYRCWVALQAVWPLYCCGVKPLGSFLWAGFVQYLKENHKTCMRLYILLVQH